jgi:hypothetical protein
MHRGVPESVGKPKMQAIGACLRKLVMICYGGLKTRPPFDPYQAPSVAARQHAIWFVLYESNGSFRQPAKNK